MAIEYKGLTIRLGADTTELNSAIRSAKKEMSGVPTELKKIERALKIDPGNAKLLEQQQADYRKAISSTEKQLEALRAAEQQIGKEEMSSEQWVKLQSDIAMCEQRLKGYRSALVDSVAQQVAANSVLGRSGAAIESWGKRLEPAGRAAQSVGGALTRTVTPAVAAMGTASIAAAIEVDDALTSVRKTVDGTEADYQRLKSAAIEFSKTNAVSVSQILDIQALGAQLGYSIDELQEFGEVVSGLDIATNMSADEAATELAQFANIMDMSHEKTRNYGSTIVDLGNNFATTEADISHMAMRIAGAGKQLGLSEADVLGLATALSSMGIEAEAGGTAISTIMAQIDKDVSKGTAGLERYAQQAGMSAGDFAVAMRENAAQFKGLADANGMTFKGLQAETTGALNSLELWASTANMSAEEFAKAWGDDAVGALSAVLVGMDKATQEGGNMSIMLDDLGITSIRQTDTLKRLANNSEFLGRAVETANEAWEENSALQTEVDNRNQSLSSQFEILKNRAVAMAEKFGGPLCRAILDVLERAEPLIDALSRGAARFDSMTEAEQDAVLQTVALSAALGPMLSIVGTGMTKVQEIGRGMSSLSRYLARAGTAADGASASFSRTRAGLSLLGSAAKALTMGAVVVALVAVAGAARDAYEHHVNLARATEGLRDPMAEMGRAAREASDGMASASAGAEEYSGSIDKVQRSLADGAKSQAEFADSMSRSFSDAGAKIGMLDGYADTIEGLYGKADLTAEEQMRLSAALDAVAEASGQSIQMVQDEAGAFVGMQDGAVMAKDAILALVDAQVIQIRQSAVESQMEEAFKQQAEAADRLASAHKELQEAQRRRSEVTRENYETDRDYREALEANETKVNAASRAYQEAQQQMRNADGAVKALTDETGLLSLAMDKGAGSIEALVAGNSALMSALSLSGKSSADFAAKLSDAGVSAEDFARLSDEALMGLAESYDGTFASIEGSLRHNGVAWDENAAKVTDAATLMRGPALTASEEVAGAFAEMTLRTGTSSDEFKQKLAEAGTSAEDFNSLTSEQLRYLLQNYDGDINAIKRKLDEFVSKNRTSGTQGGSGLASNYGSYRGAMSSSASGLVGAAAAQTGRLPSIMNADGTNAGKSFAAALPLYSSTARTNAGKNADAAKAGMTKHNGSAKSWGEHLTQAFGSGIGGMVNWVTTKAMDVANAVKGILGHTVPKEGPLHEGGEGEKLYGRHSVENYAEGMMAALPEIERASEAVARTQAAALSSAPAAMEAAARVSVRHEAVVAASRTVTVRSDPAQTADMRALSREVASLRRELPAMMAAAMPDVLRAELNGREFMRAYKDNKGAI